MELGVLLCPREAKPRAGEYYPGTAGSKAIFVEKTNEMGTQDGDSPCAPAGSPFLHRRKSYAHGLCLDAAESMVLRFVVKDYGQGLSPHDYARIFQPFRQASRETEQVYGGTGLGLAITAKLVNALGGTLSVASQKGAWTRFTVDIPFVGAPVPVGRFSLGLSDASVLLVGPDCPERAQVCHYLEAFGASFQVFDTITELDEAISTENFLEPGRSYICLIQEECYEEETYQLLAELASSVLFTYGPYFRVAECDGHFRSLCQVLPSVLVKAMLTALKNRQTGRERSSLHRQPSFSGIQDLYHDYNILIAEDNQVNQKVLSKMLNRIGINRVRIVDNGQEAVEADREECYDIILMDMQMPVLDGVGACKQILARQDRGMERTPTVIFVTANVSASSETACNNAGGSGFLSKPFNIPELERTLRSTYLMREIAPCDDVSENTELL